MLKAPGKAGVHPLGLRPPGRNVEIFADDAFIVSYPKSGNTWFRAFLTNLRLNGDTPASINELDGADVAAGPPPFTDGGPPIVLGGGARARYARLVPPRLRLAAPAPAEQARGDPARGSAQGGIGLWRHPRRARRMHADAQAAGRLIDYLRLTS